MKYNPVQKMRKRIEEISNGEVGHELDVITVAGLQVVEAHEGFVRCTFVIPITLADKDGNWEVGAMATLIDGIGGFAVYFSAGHAQATVDFNISFYSAVKIQEEVEIVAEVRGDKGRLTSVQIEVRKKDNGELIALAKQWTVSTNIRQLSKL